MKNILKNNKTFRKVRYKTGHIITHQDGTKYEVQKNGEWRKINVLAKEETRRN